jgi:hypothetical protein
MRRRAKHSFGRTTTSLVTVTIVFGLAVLMVVKRYDPAVITTVVTGTSLAAAELVRQLRRPSSATSESDNASEVDS